MPVFRLRFPVVGETEIAELLVCHDDINQATECIGSVCEGLHIEMDEGLGETTKVSAELLDSAEFLVVYMAKADKWCVRHKSGAYASFTDPQDAAGAIEMLREGINLLYWTDEQGKHKDPVGMPPGLNPKEAQFMREVTASSKHIKYEPSSN